MYAKALQGSSQKKIKKRGGSVLRSKHICRFSDHINYFSSERGPKWERGGGGSPSFSLPTLARSLRSISIVGNISNYSVFLIPKFH